MILDIDVGQQGLLLDWLWLYLQITILLSLIITELLKKRNRNLYLLLISATCLILVQGQAYWVLDQFNDGLSFIEHFHQLISREGARLANFYLGLSVICFVATYQILYRKAPRKNSSSIKAEIQNIASIPSLFTYYFLTLWVFISVFLLIQLLGGFVEAFTNPGRSVGGQAFLLILIGIGRLPLLSKIQLRQPFLFFDLLLFTVAFIITLFNSRILAIFFVLQAALMFNYCHQDIPRKWLLLFLLGLITIFMIYGIYRDYGNITSGQIVIQEGQDFLEARLGDKGVIDWFYRFSVEGFAGVARILTYEMNQGYLNHDFGLSNLVVITLLIPNSLRSDVNLPFYEIHNFFLNIYPYPQAIYLPSGAAYLPSGFENSYAHFGLIGLLLFGCLLGFLAHKLYIVMLNEQSNRLRNCMLSTTCSLQLIRGEIAVTIFFLLTDLIIYKIYSNIVLLTGKKIRI